MTIGIRTGAGTGAGAEACRHRPAVGRARQFARHPAPLPGPGRGGSGARVRAARQLRAAGPDRRTDDPGSAGCARRRRGADQRAVVRRSPRRSSRGRPWARSTRPSSIDCASSRASRRPAARTSCRWNTAGAARSSGATSRRCAAKKRRRRSITRSAKAISKRWAPRCSTAGSSRRGIRRRPRAVVVLNETAAKRYFTGESPVGREMLSWAISDWPARQEPDLAGGGGRTPDSAASFVSSGSSPTSRTWRWACRWNRRSIFRRGSFRSAP